MNQHDRLLDHIRRLALQGMGERRTDGQLLEQFISERDESAFALLLRRHGTMVWSVCRRILGNSHDADDAFQAVFLVLVRKADSVRPREAVGNWLYGVAYRTALEARGRIARRRTKERPLQDVPQPENKADTPDQELWPILDRELSRLPDKYRLPIILCDLEGRSRKEVAQQLAIPEGTLSSRLATARKKLAARLARCGFTASGMSLAALLTENTATAAIAPSLFMTTTKAALLIAAGPAAAGIVSATVSTLTEGVIKTMFIAKIKTTALVLCSVAALGVGSGGVYYQTCVGAADPQQLDRVALQDTGIKPSKRGESDIDSLKRENERLKNELERSQKVEEVLQSKLSKLEQVLEKMGTQGYLQSNPNRGQNLGQSPNSALVELEQKRIRLQAEYKERCNMLQALEANLANQQKSLEEQQKNVQDEFRKKFQKFKELEDAVKQKQARNQPSQLQTPTRSGVDKLDQILQRLERLEKRLDRLEKVKQ